MDRKLKASPQHTVSLRCASRSPSPVAHTAQIKQRSPLRRVMNGISCCALAIGTVLLIGCGGGLSGPGQDSTVVSFAQCSGGLAAQDLAGQCRTVPPTMGALETSDGTGTAGASIASFDVAQTASRSLQISWQPLDNNASGYMVYFGKTADTANVFVSDLPADSGLIDSSAPTVTYDSARDLGLYAGDSVCFRIHAYDLARALSDLSTLVCTAV